MMNKTHYFFLPLLIAILLLSACNRNPEIPEVTTQQPDTATTTQNSPEPPPLPTYEALIEANRADLLMKDRDSLGITVRIEYYLESEDPDISETLYYYDRHVDGIRMRTETISDTVKVAKKYYKGVKYEYGHAILGETAIERFVLSPYPYADFEGYIGTLYESAVFALPEDIEIYAQDEEIVLCAVQEAYDGSYKEFYYRFHSQTLRLLRTEHYTVRAGEGKTMVQVATYSDVYDTDMTFKLHPREELTQGEDTVNITIVSEHGNTTLSVRREAISFPRMYLDDGSVWCLYRDTKMQEAVTNLSFADIEDNVTLYLLKEE